MAIKQYRHDFYQNEIVKLDKGRYSTSSFEPIRWGKYYPYQFHIVVERGGTELQTSNKFYKKVKTFVLPISPQDLSMSMPFATTLTPTLGGVVEQHNGAPFRDISLTGTTGVNLVKHSAFSQSKSGIDILNELAPGTLGAGTRVIYDVQGLIGGRTGKDIYNIDSDAQLERELSEAGVYKKSTGYYQFMALRSFMEAYAEAKKRSGTIKLSEFGFKDEQDVVDSKDLRLVLAIDKENDWYLCSAVNFAVRRSANDPFLYNYSISLRSFKRIPAQLATQGGLDTSSRFSPNEFRRWLDKIRQANDVLLNSGSAINRVPGDISNTVGSVIKTASTLLKSASGVTLALGDLPDSVSKEIENAGKQFQDLKEKFSGLGWFSRQGINEQANSGRPGNGQNQDVLTNYKDPPGAPGSKSPNAPLSALGFPLPVSVTKTVNAYLGEQAAKSATDLKNEADTVLKMSDSFASVIGKMPQKYAETYGLQTNYIDSELNLDEFDAAASLLDIEQSLYALSTKAPSKEDQLPSTMEYVAGFANRSGLAFTTPVSKFAIPFPYGMTLERLAQLYLGDKDRWHEIAVLNGLQSPFVDEEGWNLELLLNGNNNTVVVPYSSNVYLNQPVWVYSATKPREKRTVINLKRTGNSLIVTLKGTPDLDKFKKIDGARLEGFLPNTVNSQQILFIPSSQNIPDQGVFDLIPGVDHFDPLLQIAGTDLLLDNDGDLIITPDGGTKIAYGLQSIVQQAKIALSTERGSLLAHPGFGTSLGVGISTADISPSDILSQLKSMFNNSDVFTDVSGVSIKKNGPSLSVSLILGIKGIGKEVPITFSL